MNYIYIKKIIDFYIKSDIDSYIIYPFGKNGKKVKHILNNFYSIEPRLIVDNQESLHNSGVIDFRSLSKEIREGDYFILTIEDEKLNKELEEQLISIVEKKRIINLQKIAFKKYIANGLNEARYLLQINKIIPNDYLIKRDKNGLIRVGIVHPALSAYNSIKTICDAFDEDDDFNLTVIIGEEFKAHGLQNSMENQMNKEKRTYLWSDEYQEKDKFDICILTNPYDMTCYKKVVGEAKLIVVVFFTLITYSSSDDFIQIMKKKTEIYKPDCYLFERSMYRLLKAYPDFENRLIEMGNAKFDEIYNKSRDKSISLTNFWKKLKGKKVVLWATSHGIHSGGISDGISFDIFAQSFFEYANNHTEMGFIFRPHECLMMELVESGIWSEDNVQTFKRYCDQSPNIIYDDTESYENAYALADAILTDALCGVLISALPMLRPIGVMYRDRECQKMHYTGFMKDYYSVCNKRELWDFLDMIAIGNDPMLLQRTKMAKQLIQNFDGNNGMRIKEYIAGRYADIISTS